MLYIRNNVLGNEVFGRKYFGDACIGAVALTARIDSRMSDHVHDFAELAFVRSGTAMHRSAVGEEPITTRSVIIVPSGEWHGYANCRDFATTLLLIDPALFDRELSWFHRDVTLSHLIDGIAGTPFVRVVHAVDSRRWNQMMHSLSALATAESGSAGEWTRRVGNLLCVVGELGTSLPTASVEPAAVRSAMALLERHTAHDWKIEELAKAVGFSPAQLTRLFKAHVGMAPITFLVHVRTERAASLLAGTDLSIAEVGRRVGWTDPNYAARRFRVAYGLSPTAYRKRYRRFTTRLSSR